jgi:hypothetical protein
VGLVLRGFHSIKTNMIPSRLRASMTNAKSISQEGGGVIIGGDREEVMWDG